MKKQIIMKNIFLLCLLLLAGCSKDDETVSTTFKLTDIRIGDQHNQATFVKVDPTTPILLEFSDAVDESTIKDNIKLTEENTSIQLKCELKDGNQISITSVDALKSFATYKLVLYPGMKSASGEPIFTGKVYKIQTGMDYSDKFDRIPDEDLLTLVQRQTFNYFWELGHEVSGMARERNTSGDRVTTGGTGFGVMATVVASERGFITRQEALARIRKITTFLDTKCEKYHGAYAHWINGTTGKTLPFSAKDDAADLVETSLLFQGLLTARAYFNQNTGEETALRNDITRLWEAIEWTWFQKDGQNHLYWHWSPTNQWDMNMKITGWNESLITYVLAASSPTYSINKAVYDEGWARSGKMKNGKTYYSYPLPLGEEKGGPLFLSQYSFLGINPKNLTDTYANYWEQNKNHSLIHYNYCIENPKGFDGYGDNCWGLTASDGNEGYSAYSPTNDKGVIAPTAALSAFPYTPEESMKALHFYYYKLGDKIWTNYGFVDAFNLSAQWYDKEHIAIDQGPIISMIENYRTSLLWNLFMSDPEIKAGMKKLGFESPNL